MNVWIRKNYKWVIAVSGAVSGGIITYVISPSVATVMAVMLNVKQIQASDVTQERRIERLEEVSYKMDARFELIQQSLKTIENREYQALRQARLQK